MLIVIDESVFKEFKHSKTIVCYVDDQQTESVIGTGVMADLA